MLVGKFQRLIRLDVAGDDEDRVLRRVKAPVIGERVLAAETLDFVAPADNRRPIGVVGEQSRLHRLVELRIGIRVAVHAALFEHHVALGRHDFVGENEAGHAVSLERHHLRQMLFGDALKVGGKIVAGKRILLAADRGDRFREFAFRMRQGAFEHQMFKKVRYARFAGGIVGRAVAIPDHVGDDGRPAIGDDDDLKAVVEFLADDAGGRRRRRIGNLALSRHGWGCPPELTF